MRAEGSKEKARTGGGPKGLAQIRVHLFENVDKSIGDVVEPGFGGGHVADDGVERHAWAFHHVGIPDAVHTSPGVDDRIGGGRDADRVACG